MNTGSLGQNRKYINLSDYIIYDSASGAIELKHFVFDVSILINKMKTLQYPKICIEYYEEKTTIL